MGVVTFLLPLLLATSQGPSLALAHCWRPGTNPFVGAPEVTRIDRSTVRLDWASSFRGDGSPSDCAQVDFMVKSHPRFQASAYKLSDLTAKGQTSAVLNVDASSDFVFQVIAREDKGPSHGIDYKYSSMVTSYATDGAGGGEGGAGAPVQAVPQPQPRPRPQPRPAPQPPVTQPPAPQPPRRQDTGLSGDRDQSPVSRFRRPEVRSMPSIYDDYRQRQPQQQGSRTRAGGDMSRCAPILDKLEGFGPGSKMQQDRLIINFIRYMNQRPFEIVDEFLQTKKSCKESHKKGFEVQCQGRQSCCDSPWAICDSGRDSCFSDYFTCDGRCISRDWVGDGWPDCMDGSDEQVGVGGRLFHCVQCSGVILPAAQLCRSSGRGLSEECVMDFIGQGECNICVKDYLG